MTIMDALRWANNKLKRANIDSPMLDAEILLAHVLGLTRAKLFAHFNDTLRVHEQEKFLLSIERRTHHEPIAYIIGKKPFYGRDFLVNPFVLIPRPDTELLVAQALEIASQTEQQERILFVDIGTGSGAIAVTLAAETHLPVVAVDTSTRALSVAKQNAEQHTVSDLVDFKVGDLATPVIELFETLHKHPTKPANSVFPFAHLIVCANLPYLTTDQLRLLDKDVQAFEPHEALVAGPDGLEAYWQLFRQLKKARSILPRQMTVLIEIDPSQSTRAASLIKHVFPNTTPEVHKDLGGLDRLVITSIDSQEIAS